MAKTLSITVHPAPLGAEHLTVADAMRQVLDIIEALERTEAASGDGGRIVWRLQSARTNSPPFTVVAEATGRDPAVSVALEANRVTYAFASSIEALLSEQLKSEAMDEAATRALERVFKRNLNGIGRTDISFPESDNAPILIVPAVAQRGLIALERAELNASEDEPNLTRTEYGAREGEIIGIVRYYDRPALSVKDWLTREKLTVTLGDDLASQLGFEHKWSEAWEGQRVLISGDLHYDAQGNVRRIDADDVQDVKPRVVRLVDLEDIDILDGLTVTEHLSRVWGENG